MAVDFLNINCIPISSNFPKLTECRVIQELLNSTVQINLTVKVAFKAFSLKVYIV